MQHKVIDVLNTGKVHCPSLQVYKICNICIKKLHFWFQQLFCKFSVEYPEYSCYIPTKPRRLGCCNGWGVDVSEQSLTSLFWFLLYKHNVELFLWNLLGVTCN